MMHRKLTSGVRLAGVVLAAALLAACGNSGSSSDVLGKTKPLSRARPVQISPQSTVLKAGPAPINFIFGQGGPVRIVDTTARKTLVQRTVNPGTIISIDTKAGILLDRDTVKAGPLAAEHQYEVWWDAGK